MGGSESVELNLLCQNMREDGVFYALKIQSDAKILDLKKMVEEKSNVKLSDMELHTTNKMLSDDD